MTADRVRTILLAVVVAAAHLPAVLRAGFAYDDGPAILDRADLRAWSSVPGLLRTEYWGADRANQMYRPLQQASYVVDGAAFDFDRVVSHAIHAAWHVAAVLAGHALLGVVGLAPGPRLVAAAAFGVHPSLMDASTWISGRCDVQALLFSALALRILLGAGPLGAGRAALAALWFLLGALSKEVALATPGVALVLGGRRVLRATPWFLAALAVYVVLRLTAVPGFLPGIPNENGVVLQDRAPWERVAIGARAQILLVGRLLAPWTSVADHRAHPAALPETPVGLDGAAAVVLFLGVVVAGARARGGGRAATALRLVAAAALYFVPVLQIWPIGAVMPERFLYVPALFLCGAAAHAFGGVASRAPRAAGVAAAVLVGALALRLAERVDVYRDDGTYFADVLRAYPRDERAWNNLGVYRMLDARPPDFDGADAAFAEALVLRPLYRRARLNAARAALERRRVNGDASRLPRVEEWLGPGLEADDPDALGILGRAELFRAKDAPDADARIIALERAEAAFVRAGAWREAAAAADALGAADRAAGYRARLGT